MRHMKYEISMPGKKWRRIPAVRVLCLFLALFPVLLMSGCQRGFDIGLSPEYYGTRWKCTEPYAEFTVDDKGVGYGTIVLDEKTLPVRYLFVANRDAFDIDVMEEGSYTQIFYGPYKVRRNKIIVTGQWGCLLEKVYNIPYEEGKYTLVFEQQK